jgi:hypothetical protein
MAKKTRGGSGGGSSMGLIITLVFFVLATVILGVTTYLGFADQEANTKAKNEAVLKEKTREDERNWERFKVRILRQYMGHAPAGLDAADLAREREAFNKNALTYAEKQGDKAEFKGLLETLDKTMAWKGAGPSETYESRLKKKDEAYAVQVKANTQLKGEKEDAERKEKEAVAQLEEEKKNFKEALVKLDKKVDDDRKTDRETIAKLTTALDLKGREKEKETLALADNKRQLDAANTKSAGLERKVQGALRDLKETRDNLDEYKDKLKLMYEKYPSDVKALEQEALDKKAKEVLLAWKKDWQIMWMDRKGTLPYINLGSADGLTPQVTFSVHSLGLDGRMNPSTKGTVEVVRVTGPHSAQVRVTSIKDAQKNPIIKGDRLFNATWDPNRKRRVALAGIADLGGDGTDNTEDFRRLLRRQNVDLDAYVDTKDDKAPKLVGRGVSVNTDYLVLADTLESVNHPKARDKAYVAAFDRLVAEMKAKANANAVTVITLRKYLDMIGYRAPKVVTGNR